MIGKRIKELRMEKGLSLSELAERAGVAKSYLSSIERDIQSNPSIQFLHKIANVLNINAEELMSDPEIESNTEHEKLDREWLELAREAMESGISTEEFREFLEFQKWQRHRKDNNM